MAPYFHKWEGSPLTVGILSDLVKLGLTTEAQPLPPSTCINWLLTTIRQGHPFPMLVAQDGVAIGDTAKYLASWLWLWENYRFHELTLAQVSDYQAVFQAIRSQRLTDDETESLMEWHQWITRKPVTIWEMP